LQNTHKNFFPLELLQSIIQYRKSLDLRREELRLQNEEFFQLNSLCTLGGHAVA
jgi:hypothetical protein